MSTNYQFFLPSLHINLATCLLALIANFKQSITRTNYLLGEQFAK
jgi:hypothetical protein